MDLQNQPSTQADPPAAVADLRASERRLFDPIDVMEQRLLARIEEGLRGMETRLIRAFDFYAEINTRRLTQAEWIRLPPVG
jgi:hypothetical protein